MRDHAWDMVTPRRPEAAPAAPPSPARDPTPPPPHTLVVMLWRGVNGDLGVRLDEHCVIAALRGSAGRELRIGDHVRASAAAAAAAAASSDPRGA